MTRSVSTLESVAAYLLAPALLAAGLMVLPAHVVWRQRWMIVLVSLTALLFATLGWVAIERNVRPAWSAIARNRHAEPARVDRRVGRGQS